MADNGQGASRPLIDPLVVALGLAVIALDQITKYLVVVNLGPDAPRNSVEIIGSYLRLVYITNTGAAFSIFSGQTSLLALFSAIAVPIILFGRRLFQLDGLVYRLGLGLLLGGTVGNLIDRVRLGYVVDFIDAGIGNLRWYVFNVADSGTVVGVLILVTAILFSTSGQNGSEKAEAGSQAHE